MRVLLIHNHYKSASPSGEDITFQNERDLLESAGHEVISYSRYNDEIGASIQQKTKAAAALFWSQESFRNLDAIIKANRPDIAHFHNTFPLISSSGYSACQQNRVPVVQTLHNYRLICPGALLMRHGKPCEKCVDGSLINAVRHACYRDSRPASALVSAMLITNRLNGVYKNSVDQYICLTKFAKQRFIRGGLPENKITVRANALMSPPNIGEGKGGYALFVGRLSQEKGVKTLIKAWEDIKHLPLKIVGDGPLSNELKQTANDLNKEIEFLGLRKRDEIFELLRNASMLIIPSEWYEGFPVTAMEAMACGTPMIVSKIGALDEILIETKQCLKFIPGDFLDLRKKVHILISNEPLLQSMRSENRKIFEDNYSTKRALGSILEIYTRTIENHHSNAG